MTSERAEDLQPSAHAGAGAGFLREIDALVELGAATCSAPIAVLCVEPESGAPWRRAFGIDPATSVIDDVISGLTGSASIPDITADARWAHHAGVLGSGLRACDVVSVRMDIGGPLGRLYVFDREPRQRTERERAALRIVGARIARTIELRRDMAAGSGVSPDTRARMAGSAGFARNIMDGSTNAMVALDVTGTVTYVNRSALDMSGYEEHEVLGAPFSIILRDADVEPMQELFVRAITLGEHVESRETEIVRKDGTSAFVRFSAGPVEREGKIVAVTITAEDITARKRNDALIAAQRRLLETIALRTDQAEVLNEIALLVEEQSGTLCSIVLLDDDGETLRPAAAPSLPPSLAAAIDGLKIGPSVGSCGTAAYRRAPVITRDVQTDPLWVSARDLMANLGLRSSWSAPFFDEAGAVLGTLAMYTPQPSLPSDWEMQVTDFATRLAAIAVQRHRARARIVESEARYRDLFENANDILYTHQMDGTFLSVNAAGLRAYGYTSADIGTLNLSDIMDAGSLQSANEHIRSVARDGLLPAPFDLLTHARDGTDVWVEVNTRLVRRADGSRYVQGIARDVTDRRRVQDALRKSEVRYRALAESIFDVVTESTLDGRIRLVTDNVEAVLGYKPSEFIGRIFLDVVHPDDLPAVVADFARASEAATLVPQQFRSRHRDGSWRWLETSATAYINDEGERLVLAVSRDITERKNMEEAVRSRSVELESMYVQLMRAHSDLEDANERLQEKSALLGRALEAERDRARRDQLTGLLNHAAITDAMRERISQDGDTTLAIAMVDVDGLKAANDTYGHQIGDAVLVLVAEKLSRSGAIVGRYGGDEFIAILPGADRGAAEAYRDEVLASLSGAGLIDPETGANIPVVASLGIAVYPEEAAAVDDLIRLSDSAMYASRRERPEAAPGRVLSRTLGGDRAAKMVGEIVPLLTSAGSTEDKLRLVAHRLSVGAGYDGVHFVVDDERKAGVASSSFARVPEADLESWDEDQSSNVNRTIARVLNRTRRPIIIDDLATNELLPEATRVGLTGAGLHSCMIAPMVWEDELIGAMSVASKRLAAFSVRDAEFGIAVATQVTAIVQMSRVLEQLRTSSAHLREAHESTVLMLASAAEAHDRTTGRHLERVRLISEALAHELGFDEAAAKELGMAAILHDIGKIRVPDTVLGSSQSLAEAEWVLMKQHTVWGSAFLTGQPGFELAAMVARCHHERWDGAGYPDGLAGEAIPEAAQITTVADSFDAMTNDRPYRNGRPIADAVDEIVACSGTQFSPRVVDALVRLFDRGELAFLHPDDTEEQLAA